MIKAAKYSMDVPYRVYGEKFADAQMAMRLDTIVKTGGKTFTEKLEFQFFNSSSAVKIEVCLIHNSNS